MYVCMCVMWTTFTSPCTSVNEKPITVVMVCCLIVRPDLLGQGPVTCLYVLRLIVPHPESALRPA